MGSLGHTTEKLTANDPGLIYMRANWYDCEIGRFISMAPSRNGMNWFWYANSNPTNLVDPDGRQLTPTEIVEFVHNLPKGKAEAITRLLPEWLGSLVTAVAIAWTRAGWQTIGAC